MHTWIRERKMASWRLFRCRTWEVGASLSKWLLFHCWAPSSHPPSPPAVLLGPLPFPNPLWALNLSPLSCPRSISFSGEWGWGIDYSTISREIINSISKNHLKIIILWSLQWFIMYLYTYCFIRVSKLSSLIDIYMFFPFRNVEIQVIKGLASSDEKFSNTPIYITSKNVDGMDWITVSFLNAGKSETGC